MPEEIRFRVPGDEDGLRFDRVVARAAGTSRAEAIALITSGAATVDGEARPKSAKVPAGAVVVIRPAERAAALPSADVPFTVALDDGDVLVVDKPAGVVVHPGAGHAADTLVNGLVGDFPELRSLGAERNWGLVHRLDRGTSGLLIVARTVEAHSALQDQLRRRRVERHYLALATGRVFDNETGTIDAPIARDPDRATRMAVVRGGRPSRTHYTRLARWGAVALMEVRLETGRTHQIRVHFSSIGAPLAGDATYGSGPALALGLHRVFLHAFRLAFTHPVSGDAIEVRSSLPDELGGVLGRLGEPEDGLVPDLS